MSFYMLHPKDLERIRKEKNAIVVDVREYSAYTKYHYRNAINMPYSEKESWLNGFYAGQTYILYCDYGNVSLYIARSLSKRGIVAYTVIGGAKELRRYYFCD